jgi:hypothetical protein
MSVEILDWRGFDHWPIKFSSSPIALPKNTSFRFSLCGSETHPFMIWWLSGGERVAQLMAWPCLSLR